MSTTTTATITSSSAKHQVKGLALNGAAAAAANGHSSLAAHQKHSHLAGRRKPQQQQQQREPGAWKVYASDGALNTSNPIREIIETMNLAENPDKKVIPLSIGDPTIFGNLKPCNEILNALREANSCGKHYGYQTAAGMESARDAVAEYHFKCTGNTVNRQDVILASGCSHAIDLCICVLARFGQNILIPRPGFPLYKTLTSVYGVGFKQYNLIAEKNWSIDLEHLESLIDDKTAAIVINNPSNPCGSVFSKRHLLQILELAERHRLPIISDEIYDKFVFSPEHYSLPDSGGGKSSPAKEHRRHKSRSRRSSVLKMVDAEDQFGGDSLVDSEADDLDEENLDAALKYVPFRSLSKLSETVPILTCGGISKTCLIPGLRLGWIIINDRGNKFDSSIRNGLNRLTQRLMGPNSLVQGALKDILNNVPESFYKQTMDFIFRNAKLCYDKLKVVRGLQPFMPQGSMYLMVRFEAESFPQIRGDLDFTSKLMNEESVLVLPGKCFDFPNYFRICLTVPTNVMEEALVRISEFCQRHYMECEQENREQEVNKSLIKQPIGKQQQSSIVQVAQMSSSTKSIPSKQKQLRPELQANGTLVVSSENNYAQQSEPTILKLNLKQPTQSNQRCP